jgi:adenylate kinase family enzyme
MIITIEGDKGTGKTTMAGKIVKGAVSFYSTPIELYNPFWTSNMSPTTQYIVIDGIDKGYGNIKKMFNKKMLNINRKDGKKFSIVMPTIILVK